MTTLLELREKIKQIYAKYSIYLNPVFRFILALFMFFGINNMIGALGVLKNPFVLVILALICSILPVRAIVIVAMLLILGNAYAIGLEGAAIGAILLLIVLILFFRFAPGESLALILTPIAFWLHIPCAVPICFGLKRNPISAISVGCGTVTYFYMKLLQDNRSALGAADTAMADKIKLLLDGFLKDPQIALYILTFAVTLVLVYVLRRTSVDYAWHIAIVVGGVAFIAVMTAGSMVLDINLSIVMIIVGTVVSCLVAYILEFFVLCVDYSRTEQLQFEDDEYYYYVRAVPKISITAPQREIKTISDDEELAQEDNLRDIVGQVVGDVPTAQLPDLGTSAVEVKDYKNIDFEKKLEESLKDL